MHQGLGIHEKVELHELLTMKTVCAAKAMAMKELVNDPQLRNLLEQDARKSREHINELQGLITGGPANFQ
ncbi:MAG: spore coat protein [Dethiobacteria bacterium]|nr:spore coat protein [Bacillota bacterium]HOP69998.1 spore coat protein [Bacillota bacterium]HQD06858.1 spore coat protein [Bacillota bacterium]